MKRQDNENVYQVFHPLLAPQEASPQHQPAVALVPVAAPAVPPPLLEAEAEGAHPLLPLELAKGQEHQWQVKGLLQEQGQRLGD